MSTAGKAARSASGAAMSKYDVEVEERLQKLEKSQELMTAELSWLKGKMEELTAIDKTGPTSDSVEGKLDILISVLKRTEKLNIEKLSGGRL